jgi:predicted TIM-barrel fold metal-dependent hydrolase
VYIHPQLPSEAVVNAYYTGFDPVVNDALSGPAFGWHAETGIQFIRLILAGTFDKLPNLQVILGHWGEAVFFYIERVNLLSTATKGKLDRTVAEYFKENCYLTPSGMFFPRMMHEAIQIIGVDRIMYSVDYPFVSPADGAARHFLMASGIPDVDKAKIAHGNWERLAPSATH